MADKDTEIEIRISLDAEAFSRVEEKLKEIARFEKTTKQVDEYFTPAHKDFLKPDYPFEWLRIGRRGGKVILTYKHLYPENTEVFTHCDEFETEVTDAERLDKIFSALGLKSLVVVEKERRTYVYNDEFEVLLDDIKNLGQFIEIEAIGDLGGVEATRKRLFEFAGLLDIDISKIQNRGYAYLLMKKMGLIK